MAATNAVNANENKKVKVCMGHSRPVPHIAISYPVDDSYWFVSSCLDGKPMLRNGETGDWVGTFEGHKGAVWQTSFNREATRIVTGSGDFSAKVWDALTGADLQTWHMPHTVKCVDWSDDDAIIATGCMDKNVRIYDVTRYDAAPNMLATPHPQGLRGVSVTPDGTGLIAACTEVVRKWDTRTWTITQSIEIEGISGIEYNKYNNTYVVAGKGAVTLLNPNDLSVIRKYDMNEDADCAAISPDGNLIVVGAKLRVKEYDAKTGAELFLHRGHHGPVFSVRYAPDSQTYASGSEDGFVRIWPSAHVLRTSNESTATPTTGYDQQF